MRFDIELAIAVLFPVVAGVWAVWRWSRERKRDRDAEHRRLSSLYVMPLLLAADDLQSRLYNLLCLNGLEPLRRRYPTGGFAEETLYLVAQYFAYEPLLLRYSPHGTDAKVLRLIGMVRTIFASDTPELDTWCIFRTEQKTLGALARQLRAGEFGSEADVIPFPMFKKNLAEVGNGERAALAVQHLASASSTADIALGTRLRLADVQSALVELIRHLEDTLKIRDTWYEGKRKRAIDHEDIQAAIASFNRSRSLSLRYEPRSVRVPRQSGSQGNWS